MMSRYVRATGRPPSAPLPAPAPLAGGPPRVLPAGLVRRYPDLFFGAQLGGVGVPMAAAHRTYAIATAVVQTTSILDTLTIR